jgi:hypothetical protein
MTTNQPTTEAMTDVPADELKSTSHPSYESMFLEMAEISSGRQREISRLREDLATATAARLDAEGKCAVLFGAIESVHNTWHKHKDAIFTMVGHMNDEANAVEDAIFSAEELLPKHNPDFSLYGWKSPEEVKEIEEARDAYAEAFTTQTKLHAHFSRLYSAAQAKLSELEREVERLSKLVKDVGSRNATLERENANMLKTIADVETGIRGAVPEVDGLNVPIPIARRTYNAGCIIDTFRERCARLEEALQWAMQMEPSPCRCMDFATPPHVCKGHEALAGSDGGEKCPVCGAPEVDAMTPRTTYACGSSDYDQRPGTFKQACSEPATIPAGERAERQCAFS